MLSLLNLQNKFQEHLLNDDEAICHDIVATENVSTEIRLSIYSNAYRSRLLEALAANYSALQLYLGDEQFEELAHAYMEMYPSQYKSIRWFGDALENFLKNNAPYNAFPYLSELAKIEWTMTLVFDAEDCSVVSIADLAAIPHESWIMMRFKLHPSTHLIDLHWNIIPIWQALQHEHEPPELIQSNDPVRWIFWREKLTNHYCSLTPDEAIALNAIIQEKTFGEICELLCDWVDEEAVAMRAASLLKGWIEAGLITAIMTEFS